MIPRFLSAELQLLLKEYPVVTVLGPRQAGKTTLVRNTLKQYQYVNLETPNVLKFATDDPLAFLQQYRDEVIFDEIQRAPHLISYIQTIVDDTNRNGQFVLTGSHQLELRAAVSQSLSGRTALLNLLPFSLPELRPPRSRSIDSKTIYLTDFYRGFTTRIKDQPQPTQTTIKLMSNEMFDSSYSLKTKHCSINLSICSPVERDNSSTIIHWRQTWALATKQ